MKIIDAHQHLWDLDQFNYSWCKSFPALNRNFHFSDYLKAAENSGIEKTIFVECDVDERHQLEEVQTIQELANKNPTIAAIIASCRPEQRGFLNSLERLKAFSGVKGVRRVLHVVPDEVSQSKTFIENIQGLAPYQFSFDLCVLSRQLPLAFKIVEKCPGVIFILDHCGIPDIKNCAFKPWQRHIEDLAQFPNLSCKISGLPAYIGRNTWGEADLRPWVDQVIACFGWNRVLWGSDWPVCTTAGSLSTWLNIAKQLATHATEEQQKKLFWQNAERVYRLN